MTTPDTAEPEYVPTRDGWQFQVDDVLFVAHSPHLDRGNIRTALTASKGDTTLWTANVNLTSAPSRQSFIKALAEKGATVQEGYLIGLEQVCRQKPQIKGGGDTPSNKSATVNPVDWSDMEKTFAKWLLLKDKGVLRILFGAYLSHLLGGDPVWLFLVAPPGGAKTELLSAFYSAPKVYPISELTSKTFASGLDTPQGDPSLLTRLSDEILVLKDFTTILEMNRDERQAILSQLREIYDGRFDKTWGTGKELHWRGRLGFLAGVTPVIDRHQAVLSVLGERFVQLRIQQPDREEVAHAAMNSVGYESNMRQELSDAVAGCLAKIGIPEAPTVSEDIRNRLAKLANFTTRARSGVIRDGYKRSLDYAPEPESPTRFARQLYSLARGIAATRGSKEVNSEDLALVQRVALDCVPAQRRVVLRALVKGDTDETLSTSTVAGMSQYSTDTIRRALEDCQALGLASVSKVGSGKADQWSLLGDWRQTFAEMLEGDTTPPEESQDSNQETSPNGKVDEETERELRSALVCTCDPIESAPIGGPECSECHGQLRCPECSGCRNCLIKAQVGSA